MNHFLCSLLLKRRGQQIGSYFCDERLLSSSAQCICILYMYVYSIYFIKKYKKKKSKYKKVALMLFFESGKLQMSK